MSMRFFVFSVDGICVHDHIRRDVMVKMKCLPMVGRMLAFVKFVHEGGIGYIRAESKVIDHNIFREEDSEQNDFLVFLLFALRLHDGLIVMNEEL